MSDEPRRLPSRPSLEQLRTRAKELLRSYRAGDPAARERVRTVIPRLDSTAESPILADAQFVVARESGFENWPALKRFVEARASAARIERHERIFRIDEPSGAIDVRPPLTERDWDVVIEVMQELNIGRLNASGQMTDVVLEEIVGLSHLVGLDLSGSRQLTDAGVRTLARRPELEHLNLSGTAVTDRGLEVLRDLSGLRSFAIAHHRGVSDRGAAHLAACSRIAFVDLMGTQTGDEAIRALRGKPTLRRLYAGNGVTDAGLTLFHEFPAFKTWQGGEVTYELNAFDAAPTYLFLNMKTPFTDTGVSGLVGLDGLFAVNFFATTGFPAFDDSRSKVTAAGVAHLTRLPHLGWVGCCARLGNDETMRHVAAMPRLRMLYGQDMVAGDAGFTALSRSSTIEYVNGRRCENLRSPGFAALASMPALRGLSMSCKHVDDEGFAALPRFPALRELTIGDVPDESYRHVGRCPRVEILWLGKDTSDVAIEHIAGLTTLKRLGTLSPLVTDRAMEVLATMSSLEAIELHRCRGVTNAGVARLAQLPRLREIALIGLPGVTRDAGSAFGTDVRVRFSAD